MTLKEVIQKSKTVQKSKLYEVHIDFQLIETRFLTEIVQANSDEDAVDKAKKQFNMRPKNSAEFCSSVDIKNVDRFAFGTIQARIKKRNKNKSISLSQKHLLEQLCIPNNYVKQCSSWYGRIEWRLVQSLRAKGDRRDSKYISPVTIQSLFRKGLLMPVVVRDNMEDEMKIQKALGTEGIFICSMA